MTPGERERAINALHESRERLLAAVQRLSPSQLAYKPAADRGPWPNASRTSSSSRTRSLARVEKTVQQPADSPQTVVEDDALVAKVVDRSERMKGPERLMPTGRWPHHEAVLRIPVGPQTDLGICGYHGRARLRESVFPHPRRLGPLDCYQWLLLIAAHGERHRARRRKR